MGIMNRPSGWNGAPQGGGGGWETASGPYQGSQQFQLANQNNQDRIDNVYDLRSRCARGDTAACGKLSGAEQSVNGGGWGGQQQQGGTLGRSGGGGGGQQFGFGGGGGPQQGGGYDPNMGGDRKSVV